MSEKEMIAHSGRVNNDQLLTPNASKRFQELKIRRSRGPDTKRFQRWDKSQQTRPNSLVAQLGLLPVIRLWYRILMQMNCEDNWFRNLIHKINVGPRISIAFLVVFWRTPLQKIYWCNRYMVGSNKIVSYRSTYKYIHLPQELVNRSTGDVVAIALS